MSNLSKCVAVLLALLTQPDSSARAQDNAAEPVQSDGDPVDPGSQEDAGDTEYYVVEDSDDIWPDDAVSSDELAVVDTEPDAEGNPAEAELRVPPGLPLVEARPTTATLVPGHWAASESPMLLPRGKRKYIIQRWLIYGNLSLPLARNLGYCSIFAAVHLLRQTGC